ncbi:MAG: hypothetical protein M1830_003971 [Pleopsidium flavum]|nr:MAG: hypothetical protein M1830_003971 [Pleopsidium flavum]
MASLTDGKIHISVLDRVLSSGRTIRQKKFIRSVKNPTAPAPTPPTIAPPVPAPAASAAAPPEPTKPDPTPAPTFTPEQDAQLLDLKSKNTSWKQISIMMDGKPQWELRNRFKELSTPKAEEKKEEEGKGKNGEEEEKKKKEEERKKKEEEGRAKAAERKKKAEENGKGDGKKEGGGGEGKAAESEEAKVIFVADGKFNIDEMVLLHRLSERYDNRKWLEIASKFFDTTGRRVHPDELRTAFHGGSNE